MTAPGSQPNYLKEPEMPDRENNDDIPNDTPRPQDSAAPDPFDPARLRLATNYGETLGVKKTLTTLPCRKPNRHDWVRVREGEEWRLETAVFENKALNEVYLVDPAIAPELLGEIVPVCLSSPPTGKTTHFFGRSSCPSTAAPTRGTPRLSRPPHWRKRGGCECRPICWQAITMCTRPLPSWPTLNGPN